MGPRRSHKKSRNGCRECKQRRLKCDERYPCINCVKHDIPCSFTSSVTSETTSDTPIVTQAPISTLSPVTTATPSEQASPAASDNLNSGNSTLFNILYNTISGTPILPKEDWVRDLELMHHFCTVTSNTLAMREDMRHTWRVVVPLEGYENEYVMHGILAVAAVHRAYIFPSRKDLYLGSSAYHMACGLSTFRTLITSPIAQENWQSIFCFASMVVLYVFCLPIRSGNSRLPSPILNTIELFSVARGIRTILEPLRQPLGKSRLACFATGVWIDGEMAPCSASQSLLPSDFFDQISRLQQFIEGSNLNHDEQKDYLSALSSLESPARHMIAAGLHIEIGMPLIWPYQVSDGFMSAIRDQKPLALVILAHFFVLIHLYDHIWFIKGWSQQVFSEIARCVPSPFSSWLEWPRQHIFNSS